MTRLSSKLHRALVFLSHIDAVGQNLVEVYVIDDQVFFRVAVGHTHALQRCALGDLAALLQRPGNEIKAEIRAARRVEPDSDLQTRLERARAQKMHLIALKKMLGK